MSEPKAIKPFAPGSFDTPLDPARINEIVEALNALIALDAKAPLRIKKSKANFVIELAPEIQDRLEALEGGGDEGGGGGGEADPIWLP